MMEVIEPKRIAGVNRGKVNVVCVARAPGVREKCLCLRAPALACRMYERSFV